MISSCQVASSIFAMATTVSFLASGSPPTAQFFGVHHSVDVLRGGPAGIGYSRPCVDSARTRWRLTLVWNHFRYQIQTMIRTCSWKARGAP
jgi:hypothetical protein